MALFGQGHGHQKAGLAQAANGHRGGQIREDAGHLIAELKLQPVEGA